MATQHYREMNDTIEYVFNRQNKSESAYDWTYLDLEMKIKGHNVRRMRSGAVAFLIATVIYILLAFQYVEGLWGVLDYILTIIAALLVSWGTWRLALRAARRLAVEVSEYAEEGAIDDVDHPGVLFAPWIPKPTKGLVHRIQMAFRKLLRMGAP